MFPERIETEGTGKFSLLMQTEYKFNQNLTKDILTKLSIITFMKIGSLFLSQCINHSVSYCWVYRGGFKSSFGTAGLILDSKRQQSSKVHIKV